MPISHWKHIKYGVVGSHVATTFAVATAISEDGDLLAKLNKLVKEAVPNMMVVFDLREVEADGTIMGLLLGHLRDLDLKGCMTAAILSDSVREFLEVRGLTGYYNVIQEDDYREAPDLAVA